MKTKRLQCRFLVSMGILLAVMLGCTPPSPSTPTPTSISTSPSTPTPTNTPRPISILLDDFSPQPYQGESVYFFNRLEGDRGALNNSIMDWGTGQVTTTISSGNSWGGVWMSMNHPIREGLPINFSAILPPPILPAYQSQITGITVRIARGTPNSTFRLELKDGNELRWKNEMALDGGQQVVSFDLPALGNINQLVWVLDHVSAGDYVVLERVSFTATTQITDTATDAFVWSYGMLLNNWNPTTGLVRDKAKDASGEFDAIQATGSLAAATADAEQLGIVERANAIRIVNKISDTLLLHTPRSHGLWPHWVKVSPTDEITIVQNTEWSSVDTVIAAIGLLDAQSGLGMDTSGTEQMLQAIEWNDLVTIHGISHGYTYTGALIPYAWDAFGGESWLVELAYAGVTDQVAPITYATPPTANGSGFIDELAWLFVLPTSGQDYWGTDWASYRRAAADNQKVYYPTHNPKSCFTQLGLFGLSAAEVPYPSMVPQESIYQAYDVGGRFAPANDGSALLGAPVVVPHYSAMIASLHPQEAIKMWDWLIKYGYFSPLNNVESLVFPVSSRCDNSTVLWNQLKGSWNLSLQTLGWGRYLAERAGQVPILWQATTANPLLRKGYLLLAPSKPLLTPTLTPQAGIVSAGIDVWTGNGLEGRSINALAIGSVTPTTLYAGTDGGVFKSTNGGENWSAATTGMPIASVNALAIDPATPTTLYAGTDGGVFKSTNGGENWSAIGLPAYALTIDPTTPTTLYAGTYNGVFKSTNGGENWNAVTTGMDNAPTGLHIAPVLTLAIDPATPTTLYAGTFAYTYPGTMRYVRGGIFKSTNGGGSWNEVYDGNTSFRTLAIDPVTPTTLYAGKDGGVSKSTDGGGNWSAVNTGLTCAIVYALAIDRATPTTLYAGTDCGVFKSTNGGGNWSAVNTGLTNTDIRALAIDRATPTTLYAGTGSGVFKSTDGAAAGARSAPA